MTVYVEADQLEAGLPHILDSPSVLGTVELVVRRPAEGEREVLEEGVLDLEHGLVGDRWRPRSHIDGDDGRLAQVTLMNARVIDLVAGHRDRWPLAGDQLYVDLDLGIDNLPAGTLIAVGDAVLEVSTVPHLGCKKFVQRFGEDAMRFVNSAEGRRHRLRGMNTRVVTPGRVRVGDVVRRLGDAELAGCRLRSLRHEDLPLLASWIEQPHVQPWWAQPTGDGLIAEYAACIDGTDPTDVFVIDYDRRAVGMIQRYRIADYPEWVKALPAEVDLGVAAGLDYLIGDPDLIGRGIGPTAIATLTAMTFDWWPDVTTVAVAVQQANRRSWRALERAGYIRVWEGMLDSDDPSDAGPAYLYRRDRSASQ